MRKFRKAEARLMKRRRDFDKGSQGNSGDRQKSRWETGGYHRPGSMKK